MIDNSQLLFHSSWDIDQLAYYDEVTVTIPDVAGDSVVVLKDLPALSSGYLYHVDAIFKHANDTSWHQNGEYPLTPADGSVGRPSYANINLFIGGTNNSVKLRAATTDVTPLTIRYYVYAQAIGD